MACSLAAILRPISGGSTADTQLQNELTGRGRQVNGAHGFSLLKKAVGNAQALDPAAFCMPEPARHGMFDRKPSLVDAKEHSLDYPRSRRLIDKGAAQTTAKPTKPTPHQTAAVVGVPRTGTTNKKDYQLVASKTFRR